MSDARTLRKDSGRRTRVCLLNLLFLAITCLGVASTAEGAITLIVNSTRDVVDAAPGNGVCDTGALNTQGAIECTLRAAIEETNALAGADNIDFNIPTTELGYSAAPLSYTIQPTSQLPNITDPVTIDGSTQPDFPGDPIVELDGTFAGGTSRGLQIFAAGAGSTIRGLVINSFFIRGIHVTAANVTIVGNWIGLDSDGITPAPNDNQGIFGTSASGGLTLGGIVALDRNVISANGRGIHIRGDNNVVIGNYFGTDSTGTVAVAGSFGGIRLENAADGTMIGGTTPAEANIITGNSADGIDDRSTGTANSFLGNSIYSNGGIGIDLAHDGVTTSGADGVTENDAGDVDPAVGTASNNLLNFPVITSAVETGGTLDVDFDLDVIPAGNYRIEFFTNPSGADGSGNGEGEVYQSNVTIAHGGAGVESFNHTFAGSAGDILTVTATEESPGPPYGATSEFGDAFTATGVCPGGVVTSTTDSVTGGSLRACIIWANGNAGVDTLTVPAGTYTLTIAGTGEDAAATGDLDITDGIIINGNAAAATIVDGNSLDRVFDILGVSATFTNLTVSGGSITSDGGGIDVDATGSLTMSESTVSSNTTTTDGGGIATAGGTVDLTNVTLSANTADRGGAMDCTGACTLTNVTVTANTAPTAGDGVRQTGAGTITFLNTIVANNLSGGVNECDGSASNLISSGWNVSSDASCDFTSAGDQVNTDPLLGVLQNNGGPTETHALGAGSLAIDGGTDPGCPATDQRGTGRPLGGSCDIGAYEAAAQTVCPGAVVTNTIDAATGGSLRACIIWANGNVGADSISFSIPGGGPHTIRPTSGLPTIIDPVTIDGSTEPDFVTTPVIEIDGTFAGTGTTARGLRLIGGSDGSTIRALVINRFDNRGIQVSDPNVTIVGNWIGLDIDGVTAAGNDAVGLYFANGGDNATVGGTIDADRNIISGNSSHGMTVRGSNMVISHNYIGTDSTGAVLIGNGSHGIRFRIGADDTMVGGTTAAHANIIAGNLGTGIAHDSTGTANSFLRNSIYGNSGLGIDLTNDGVTENDAGDVDPIIPPAPNNLLNFPVITAATETGGTLDVDFDLDVIPAGNYRIEFFTNPSGAHPLGNGEGEVYQSAVTIAHGGAGIESFNHTFAGTAGDILTVTATLELAGPTYAATSEFGDAFTAVLGAATLEIVKRTFETDGTAIPNLSVVPNFLEFKYLLYINNKGAAVTDVSVRDVLAAAFQYQTGTIQVDNSVVECALATCTAAEELAIFTAVDAAGVLTDAVDLDTASYTGASLAIDSGNQNVGNPQLNISANFVWAILFSVKMP